MIWVSFRHNFDDDGTSARNLSDTMCRAAKGNSNFCLDEIAYKNFKKIWIDIKCHT